MEEHKQGNPVSRRDALKTIAAGVGVAATLPVLSGEAEAASLQQSAAAANAPAFPSFFNEHQAKTVEILTELIIPADDRSPGAKEAKVVEYIDYSVGQLFNEIKTLWKDGLTALDELCQNQFTKPFVELTHDQQVSVLRDISKNEYRPQTTLERFFRELKDRTVFGYYTSKIGIHQELKYKGNVYLREFQGCTHPEHQA
jgi:hypothetical protein